MILFRRFTTLFSLFLMGGLFELLLWQPKWYIIIVILLEATVIGMVLSLGRGKIGIREIWAFLISPFFFIGFAFVFLFFIEGLLFKHLFVLFIILLWWIFIENTFLFLHQSARYHAYALENITAYLNLVTIFLMAASFHSLIIFLGFSSIPLVFFTFLVTFFLAIQMILINKFIVQENLFLIILLSLLVSEMFWTTKFLPASYLVNGVILAISYYFLTGIIRHWISKSLDRQVVKRYLWISGLVLLIVVITARWT